VDVGVQPDMVRRLLEQIGVPECRHGHGPLTGWRARPDGRRGLYCRVCNVDNNRRWRARHARPR
jgi:hypothetical protein